MAKIPGTSIRLGPYQRKRWGPILTEMGPYWHRIYFKCGAKTRNALERRKLAEFRIIGGTSKQFKRLGWALFGRLTGLGIIVRDFWIQKAVEAEDRRLRRERRHGNGPTDMPDKT